MSDGRPLADRIEALGNRFHAMASGARKRALRSPMGGHDQVASNHARDAATCWDAAKALRSQNTPTPKDPTP